MMSSQLKIYPIPQKVILKEEFSFQDGILQVQNSETVAGVLKDFVEKQQVSHKGSQKNLPLYLGTPASNISELKDLSLSKEGYDAYTLKINQKGIFLLGETEDALFYGLNTLFQLLPKMPFLNKEIMIVDYANTKIRGFIEGYYGIPWSDENRISLMKFASQFKMNAYIFAPKDDPYHRDQWEELYPVEKLQELKRLAEVGNQTKCRFVWTIAPLMEVAKRAQEGEDVMPLLAEKTAILLEKFQQLYEIGVRQFGVLGDDVGALPYAYVVGLIQKVNEWIHEKGDIYNLLYCPSSYNSAWAWDP